MATVHITHQMRCEVGAKIREMYDARRDALTKEWTESGHRPALADRIRDTYWASQGVTAEAVAKMPLNWLHRLSSIRLNAVHGTGVHHAVSDVSFSPPLATEINRGSYGWNIDLDTTAPDVMALLDVSQRLRELDAEERAYRTQVDELLEKCRTLRQAVEIWPNILAVLPQRYVDRHNAPPEKRERKAIDVNIDLDKLTTATVMGRMATARR